MLQFPEAPLLADRVFLRPAAKADLPALFAIHRVDAVNRYLPYETWQSPGDGEAWWQRTLENMSEGKALQFVIVRREDDSVIGSCILFAYEAEHQRAEIGYVLGEAYWGQGYATEAVQRFVEYAWEDLRLRRLEARVDARNSASSGLLLRLGFTLEGCLREWARDGDELIDMQLFACLRAKH